MDLRTFKRKLSLVVGVGLLGFLLMLIVVGIGMKIIEALNAPSDPYEAVNSIEFERIGWYLADYQEEAGPDSLAALLEQIFTESMRLRTFNASARFCIREGMREFQPLIVGRLEHFKAIPSDSSWCVYIGELCEEYASTSGELGTVESVLGEEGWLGRGY